MCEIQHFEQNHAEHPGIPDCFQEEGLLPHVLCPLLSKYMVAQRETLGKEQSKM